MNQKQLEKINKVAQEVEVKLEKGILSQEQIIEIDRNLDITLAELGTYKRFFKRLS